MNSVPVQRTDPERFASVAFAQKHPATFIEWNAPECDGPIRIAVVDESPETSRGTFLLLHGEPSWSALYEEWIPRLVEAGFHCVAVDLPGFGRSDKPSVDDWYTYERHVEAVRYVIETLNLTRISLVVQDWAGPIGLRQAVDLTDRFDRVFIFNTWLHHSAYAYSDGARTWRSMATNPDVFGTTMPAGRIVAGTMRRSHDSDQVAAIFEAPFDSLESRAGARAFPTMLPFEQPERGGAIEQERCHHRLLAGLGIPVHVAFSDADPVFTYEIGEQWAAAIPGATMDRIPGAGHFVQYDAPQDCVDVVLSHISSEP